MIALAVALVGTLLVAALWDALRRGLAAQVRQAELRVEALRRAEYDAVRGELEALRAVVAKVQADHGALERDLAIGRTRR